MRRSRSPSVKNICDEISSDAHIADSLNSEIQSDQKYTYEQLIDLTPREIEQFTEIFGLDPTEYNIVRIMRILKFMGRIVPPQQIDTLGSQQRDTLGYFEYACIDFVDKMICEKVPRFATGDNSITFVVENFPKDYIPWIDSLVNKQPNRSILNEQEAITFKVRTIYRWVPNFPKDYDPWLFTGTPDQSNEKLGALKLDTIVDWKIRDDRYFSSLGLYPGGYTDVDYTYKPPQ